MSRRPRRWLALYALYCLGVAVLAALAAEVVLRAQGVQPFAPQVPDIRVEPGGRLYRADLELGYGLLPGRFRVRLPDGFVFTATHGQDALRITRSPSGPAAAETAPELWIFGGSFTYGWSVDDADSFPWQLQRRLRDVRVVNFGVSGYGTLQAWRSLERALRERGRPRAVVLAHGSFHEPRNTFVRSRRKRVAPFNRLGPLRQPYARLGRDGSLHVAMADVVYREWPGMRHSALIHRLEQAWNRLEERRYDSAAVTDALVRAFVASAHAAGTDLLVATITADGPAARVRRVARAAGADVADIAVDLARPGMRNLPHDAHPSGRAHARYALRLQRALRSLGID